MNKITYDELLLIFESKKPLIDETMFYFKTEESPMEHYLGYLPEYDEPYWAGYCDIEDGFCCKTAEELFNAPIYNGKSIKERWAEITIICIGCIPLDYWIEHNYSGHR